VDPLKEYFLKESLPESIKAIEELSNAKIETAPPDILIERSLPTCDQLDPL
jgi:hypothetical protein